MSKQLLKVKDVAEMFVVSKDCVYTLACEQIIPSVRLGRSLRFSRESMERFIAEGGRALPGGWKHEAV